MPVTAKKTGKTQPPVLHRMRVTGPVKGKQPAALSLGSKVLPANKDGTFNVTTANLVDLLRRGYQVVPKRASRAAILRTRRPPKPSRPTVPASAYYRNLSRNR